MMTRVAALAGNGTASGHNATAMAALGPASSYSASDAFNPGQPGSNSSSSSNASSSDAANSWLPPFPNLWEGVNFVRPFSRLPHLYSFSGIPASCGLHMKHML